MSDQFNEVIDAQSFFRVIGEEFNTLLDLMVQEGIVKAREANFFILKNGNKFKLNIPYVSLWEEYYRLIQTEKAQFNPNLIIPKLRNAIISAPADNLLININYYPSILSSGMDLMGITQDEIGFALLEHLRKEAGEPMKEFLLRRCRLTTDHIGLNYNFFFEDFLDDSSLSLL